MLAAAAKVAAAVAEVVDTATDALETTLRHPSRSPKHWPRWPRTRDVPAAAKALAAVVKLQRWSQSAVAVTAAEVVTAAIEDAAAVATET